MTSVSWTCDCGTLDLLHYVFPSLALGWLSIDYDCDYFLSYVLQFLAKECVPDHLHYNSFSVSLDMRLVCVGSCLDLGVLQT